MAFCPLGRQFFALCCTSAISLGSVCQFLAIPQFKVRFFSLFALPKHSSMLFLTLSMSLVHFFSFLDAPTHHLTLFRSLFEFLQISDVVVSFKKLNETLLFSPQPFWHHFEAFVIFSRSVLASIWVSTGYQKIFFFIGLWRHFLSSDVCFGAFLGFWRLQISLLHLKGLFYSLCSLFGIVWRLRKLLKVSKSSRKR